MRGSILLTMVAALTLGACSGAAAPATPAPFDPAGMYDFTATMGPEERTGTLELERNAAGQLVGEGWLDGEPDPAIIESVVVTGNHVDMYAHVGNNSITFSLDFVGTAFSGIIDAGGDTIQVTGTRRP